MIDPRNWRVLEVLLDHLLVDFDTEMQEQTVGDIGLETSEVKHLFLDHNSTLDLMLLQLRDLVRIQNL